MGNNTESVNIFVLSCGAFWQSKTWSCVALPSSLCFVPSATMTLRHQKHQWTLQLRQYMAVHPPALNERVYTFHIYIYVYLCAQTARCSWDPGTCRVHTSTPALMQPRQLFWIDSHVRELPKPPPRASRHTPSCTIEKLKQIFCQIIKKGRNP